MLAMRRCPAAGNAVGVVQGLGGRRAWGGGGAMDVHGWEAGLELSGDDRQDVATFDAGLLFLLFFAWVKVELIGV